MKVKNKLTKIAIGLTAITLLATGCSKNENAAATVNGVDIPKTAYLDEYKISAIQIAKQYGADYLSEPAMGQEDKTMGEQVRENILNNLVQMEILRQDAEKNDIKITDEDVNEYLDQTKEMYGGEEEFNKALTEQGITLDYYKEYIRRGLLMQEYSQTMKEKIEPKEEELKEYFEKNKEKFQTVDASHILVETEEEAKEIKAELDGGADFAELAKAKSKDPGSGQEGGNLGTFSKGQMVPEFEEKAFSMKEGEISDPVKTDFGYHIIKVNKAAQTDFESQKDMVKAQYVEEKFTEQVEKLEKDAKIKKHVDPKEEIEVDLPEEKPSTEENTKEEPNNQNANENAQDNNQKVEDSSKEEAAAE